MTAVPKTDSPAQVLIVDDDEGLLILMADVLRAEGWAVDTAGSARETREWLASHHADLMLLDLKLRDGDAAVLVDRLREAALLPPFIVVTGQGDEKVAVEVMKRGARDYVVKNSALLDFLPSVTRRVLDGLARERELAVARQERARLEEEVLAASERERQSIGADLHDGLGQQLTVIELLCAGLRADSRTQAPQLTPGLDQLGGMLREAIAQTRTLAHGLVPVGDGPDALQAGLTGLVARMDSVGRVRCRLDCPQPVLLTNSVAAGHLYRIAQEGMNNAIKHGKAKTIVVELKIEGALLILRVVDDGVGLVKKEASAGAGLSIMRHRAEVIGARLRIESPRGHGVVVECAFPLAT